MITATTEDSSRGGGGESASPHLEREVYQLLDDIMDPCSVATSNPMGLVEMGIIKGVQISAGHVRVSLRLTSPFCEMVSYMQGEAVRAITTLDGVTSCEVLRDSGLDWDHDMMSPAAKGRRQLRLLSARETSSAEGVDRSTSG